MAGVYSRKKVISTSLKIHFSIFDASNRNALDLYVLFISFYYDNFLRRKDYHGINAIYSSSV